jgi:hypothetical protein
MSAMGGNDIAALVFVFRMRGAHYIPTSLLYHKSTKRNKIAAGFVMPKILCLTLKTENWKDQVYLQNRRKRVTLSNSRKFVRLRIRKD